MTQDASHPISVLGLDHLNLRIADLDRALAFYTRVLNLREVKRNTRADGSVSLVALRAGNCVVFLQPSPGYPGTGPLRPSSPSGRAHSPAPQDGKDSGLDHYSLEIEAHDPAALANYLKAHNVPIVTGPVNRWGGHGDGTSIYVRDPDGHELELKQYNLRG